MLVFFFPFFENLGSYVYDSMHARVYGFVFERHQRTMFFVEKLYGMRARALASKHAQRSLCMLAGARGASRDGSCSRRQRRKVDKCRVADKKKTNRQTNTHYSFIGIDNSQFSTNGTVISHFVPLPMRRFSTWQLRSNAVHIYHNILLLQTRTTPPWRGWGSRCWEIHLLPI